MSAFSIESLDVCVCCCCCWVVNDVCVTICFSSAWFFSSLSLSLARSLRSLSPTLRQQIRLIPSRPLSAQHSKCARAEQTKKNLTEKSKQTKKKKKKKLVLLAFFIQLRQSKTNWNFSGWVSRKHNNFKKSNRTEIHQSTEPRHYITSRLPRPRKVNFRHHQNKTMFLKLNLF